jgi:hypothetical protein
LGTICCSNSAEIKATLESDSADSGLSCKERFQKSVLYHARDLIERFIDRSDCGGEMGTDPPAAAAVVHALPEDVLGTAKAGELEPRSRSLRNGKTTKFD